VSSVYQRGDYVRSLIPDFYPGSIWIVKARELGGIRCGRAFYILSNRTAICDTWSPKNGFLFTDKNVELVCPGYIAQLRLSGVEIPTLD
jgi:hypothetical protein